MKKLLLILFLFIPSLGYGAVCGNMVYNSMTGRMDCVGVAVTSSTLPSGSTNYIQNTALPQVDSSFNVSSATVRGTMTINGISYSWPSDAPSSDGLCLTGTASNPVVLSWGTCAGGAAPVANYALLEDTGFILLEDDSKMRLEK